MLGDLVSWRGFKRHSFTEGPTDIPITAFRKLCLDSDMHSFPITRRILVNPKLTSTIVYVM